MAENKVRVAIIGLGFGAEFIPIYQNHPQAEMYAICQRSKEKLEQLGDAFGVGVRYTKFQDVLADPNVDAIHINGLVHGNIEINIQIAIGRKDRHAVS